MSSDLSKDLEWGETFEARMLLYRLRDEGRGLRVTEIAIKPLIRSMLTSDDVYILDTLSDVCVL